MGLFDHAIVVVCPGNRILWDRSGGDRIDICAAWGQLALNPIRDDSALIARVRLERLRGWKSNIT